MRNMDLGKTAKYSVLALMVMGSFLLLSSLSGGEMRDSSNHAFQPQFEEQTLKDLVYYHKEFSRVWGAEPPEPNIWSALLASAPFLFFVILARTRREMQP